MSDESTLSDLLHESRHFPPPEEYTAAANVTADAFRTAEVDRFGFWGQTATHLAWARPWEQVLDPAAVVRALVRRWPPQRRLQLPGPAGGRR